MITNACGTSLASTTNSLALGAPGNLIWFGGQPTTAWDVGITANWDTNASNFNYGDNVTFDDNSASENVTLANNFLSPSTMTINGAGAYVFTGPGGLAGSGSIVMNRPARPRLALASITVKPAGLRSATEYSPSARRGILVRELSIWPGANWQRRTWGRFSSTMLLTWFRATAQSESWTGGQNLFVTKLSMGCQEI